MNIELGAICLAVPDEQKFSPPVAPLSLTAYRMRLKAYG